MNKIVARNTVTRNPQGWIQGPSANWHLRYVQRDFIFRANEGRIAEIWGVVAVFTQMKQLGVLGA